MTRVPPSDSPLSRSDRARLGLTPAIRPGRVERALSRMLSHYVFPHLPGLRKVYSAQLRRSLRVTERSISLRGLAPCFEGLRILLITDIHAGPFLEASCLREMFRRLTAAGPDLILLGGDLTTCRIAEFLETKEAFAELEAPLGVFGVMGNHDHYVEDPDLLRELLAKQGVRVFHNSALALERDGRRLWLAGIDDLLSGSPDLERTLAACGLSHPGCADDLPPGREPVVLLSHNPDVFFQAARRGVSLVLAGHTHGGQIRLAGKSPLFRVSRFRLDEGRFRSGEAQLIVSRGFGASGLPFRLNCPPEAVLIELRSAQNEGTPVSSRPTISS